MKKALSRMRMTGAIAPVIVIIIGILAILIARPTGGSESDLLPLVYLPIVLAVVCCPFEWVVGIGLMHSILYLLLTNPGLAVFSRKDVVRALTMNAMALIGAYFARRAERERDAIKRRMEEKDALLNASQIINAADKLEYAISSALLILPKLIPEFRCAAIFFSDDSNRIMQLYDVIGIDRSEMRFERFSLSARNLGWQAQSTTPYYVNDTETSPPARIAQLEPGARSLVCLSLRSPQSIKSPIGLLYVSSGKPEGFSPSQINLLQAFADRIGFPLQKIRIQEGLEGLAFTDGMTGLYNYRYFRNHLEDELRRSLRYRRPLSLIVLDLDSFKRVNDERGHPAGDKLLIEVANIIRKSIRETDLPARYGGEEFVIISPETLGPDAAILAERVRTSVERTQFVVDGSEPVRVSISAGIATFPDHAADDESLLNAADQALYQAKRSGKNCTVLTEAPEIVRERI